MKNRVLLISNGVAGGDSGVSGGESRYIEIAKNWAANGIKIHLLGSRGAMNLCLKLRLKTRHHLSKFKSTSNRLSFVVQTFSSIIIPASLQTFNSGIVYSTNEQLYDVLPGLIMKLRHPNLKWAVVVHWLPPYIFWKRQQSTFLNSLLFLISERLSLFLACIFADKLLAVSESTHHQINTDPFTRFFSKKVTSVNCGVDVSLVKQITRNTKKKKYDAIFMKRIQAVKGIFDLVKIWQFVVKKKPQAKLIIIGTGHDELAAKKMVNKLHLQKNISFKGPIYDFKQKFSFLSESKLFLLPTYEENWAIVIGESMAAGTPVITYNLPELIQVWNEQVVYVPLGNKRKFAEEVIVQLSHKTDRNARARKALSFISKYDWKSIAKREWKIITST